METLAGLIGYDKANKKLLGAWKSIGGRVAA